MRSIQRLNQYLKLRDIRGIMCAASQIPCATLMTACLFIAHLKRAGVRLRVNPAIYAPSPMTSVTPKRFITPSPNAVLKDLDQRAEALGFTYMPVSDIVAKLTGEQIADRIAALGPINGPYRQNAEAYRCAFGLSGNIQSHYQPSARPVP